MKNDNGLRKVVPYNGGYMSLRHDYDGGFHPQGKFYPTLRSLMNYLANEVKKSKNNGSPCAFDFSEIEDGKVKDVLIGIAYENKAVIEKKWRALSNPGGIKELRKVVPHDKGYMSLEHHCDGFYRNTGNFFPNLNSLMYHVESKNPSCVFDFSGIEDKKVKGILMGIAYGKKEVKGLGAKF